MSAPRRSEIQRIADRSAGELTQSEPALVEGPHATATQTIVDAITGDFATQSVIDREARTALDSMGRTADGMDKNKLLDGLRSRIAKQKGVTFHAPVAGGKLGEARIETMAQTVSGALEAEPSLGVGDTGAVTRKVASRLRLEFGEDLGLDRDVRARIASLGRQVPEGSREWEILYRQYHDEFARRR